MHGTAGRPRGPADQGRNRPEELVNTAGTRTRTDWPESLGQHHGPSGLGPSRPGQLVDTAGPRAQARVDRGSCQPRGPSDQDPSHAGQLGFVRKSPRRWSIMRAFGLGPQSPGTAGRPQDFGPGPESHRISGRPRGPSDPVPSCPGQLVITAGHQTRARFARESWSKPRALGHRP